LSAGTSEDEDYVQKEVVEKRLVYSPPPDKLDADDGDELADAMEAVALNGDEPRPNKVGKAKAKREKKAARQAAAEGDGKTVCSPVSWFCLMHRSTKEPG
jgi:DnaJ family protein A protein 5